MESSELVLLLCLFEVLFLVQQTFYCSTCLMMSSLSLLLQADQQVGHWRGVISYDAGLVPVYLVDWTVSDFLSKHTQHFPKMPSVYQDHLFHSDFILAPGLQIIVPLLCHVSSCCSLKLCICHMIRPLLIIAPCCLRFLVCGQPEQQVYGQMCRVLFYAWKVWGRYSLSFSHRVSPGG